MNSLVCEEVHFVSPQKCLITHSSHQFFKSSPHIFSTRDCASAQGVTQPLSSPASVPGEQARCIRNPALLFAVAVRSNMRSRYTTLFSSSCGRPLFCPNSSPHSLPSHLLSLQLGFVLLSLVPLNLSWGAQGGELRPIRESELSAGEEMYGCVGRYSPC